MAVVPNAMIAKSAITNYTMPEPRMSIEIPVRVTYTTDPERVEKVLIEETVRAAAEVPGLLAHPTPFVRLIPGFGEFALQFSLICSVESYVDQYLVQHELRKRIIRRFRTDQIEIPLPVRMTELRSTDGKALGP